MAQSDWYRNTNWNKKIEAGFYEKLARARSGRDQYLVIQAICLESGYPKPALKLIECYFETKRSDSDILAAMLSRAHCLEALGKQPEMIAAFKAVLAREAEFSNRQSNAKVEFPYVIACQKIKTEYEYALELLNQPIGDLAFPGIVFKKNTARAFIYQSRGDKTKARAHAHIAIGAGFVRKSGLRYHQNTGLVGEIPKKTLKRLMKILR